MILSYTRVSTAEQAADGTTSLGEQERKNRAIATLRGAAAFDFANFVDADVSGSVPLDERPAGSEMLATAKRGDVIVACKMDRLFRSATDALMTAKLLAARGIDLVLIDMGSEPVTQNGVSKLFFGMLALVAEFERERIAERMSDGRAAKKRNGGHIGGDPPYGFRKTGKGKEARLEPHAEEHDVLTLARGAYAKLKKPYRVKKLLDEMGVRDRKGGKWHIMKVKSMLERAA